MAWGLKVVIRNDNLFDLYVCYKQRAVYTGRELFAKQILISLAGVEIPQLKHVTITMQNIQSNVFQVQIVHKKEHIYTRGATGSHQLRNVVVVVFFLFYFKTTKITCVFRLVNNKPSPSCL